MTVFKMLGTCLVREADGTKHPTFITDGGWYVTPNFYGASIQQRILQHSSEVRQKRPAPGKDPAIPLMPLVKQHKDPHRNAIGFTLRDYLQLIDWAGRAVRDGKRGAISEDVPPRLQRIGLEPGRFLEHLQGHGATEEQTAMGHLHRIRQAAQALGRRFLKGGCEARRLYVTGAIG